MGTFKKTRFHKFFLFPATNLAKSCLLPSTTICYNNTPPPAASSQAAAVSRTNAGVGGSRPCVPDSRCGPSLMIPRNSSPAAPPTHQYTNIMPAPAVSHVRGSNSLCVQPIFPPSASFASPSSAPQSILRGPTPLATQDVSAVAPFLATTDVRRDLSSTTNSLRLVIF